MEFVAGALSPAPAAQLPAGIEAEADPQDAERWQDCVARAIGRIQGGELRKVVLAREVCLQASRSIPSGPLLENLGAAYPQAFLFAFSRGDSCFWAPPPSGWYGWPGAP